MLSLNRIKKNNAIYMKSLLYSFVLFVTFFADARCQAQIITTYAGTSLGGYSGDGGPATAAHMDNPVGLAMDKHGNLYIGDGYFHNIRMVDAAGIIHTIAGTTVNGFTGDGGPATAALLNQARAIAVDTSDNIYFVDYDNYRVRKIDATGIISTVAGNGSSTFSGDGGPATAAGMWPGGVAVDVAGNIYISSDNRIRKISASTGIITTIAGNGATSLGSDGIAATASPLSSPDGIAIDKAGNIYLAEYGHSRVRKINTSGIIYTVAGTGVSLTPTLGAIATATPMHAPAGVLVDDPGNIYITDYTDNGVYEVDVLTGKLVAFAGNGVTGYSGDGGQALLARVLGHCNMATDYRGNIYIADLGNKVVRKVHDDPASFYHGHLQTGNVCGPVSISENLVTSDIDIYQHLQWSLVRPPARGTASVSYYQPVIGPVTDPFAATYTPTSYGVDTFVVRVTDGMVSDTTMIVTNNYPSTSGTLTGMDTVCTGATITLSSSVTGGTWAASNGHASVTAGVVSGVSAGTVTISYRVSNPCAPAASAKTIVVKDCTTGILPVEATSPRITIYPNPAQNSVTLSIDAVQQDEAFVRITDITGKILLAESIQRSAQQSYKHELDLRQLAAGIYFVDVTLNGQHFIGKLTKM